jgi:hypothetical protein
MATTSSNTDSAPDAASTAPARRSRRSDGATRGAARGRRPRVTGDDLVTNLAEMVDQLVKENRELKRAIARAEKAQAGGGLGQSTRVLSALQRRVSRALSSEAGRGRRRGAEPAAAPARPRRKVTDPDVLERRRQALAKARAARAAKRLAAQSS